MTISLQEQPNPERHHPLRCGSGAASPGERVPTYTIEVRIIRLKHPPLWGTPAKRCSNPAGYPPELTTIPIKRQLSSIPPRASTVSGARATCVYRSRELRTEKDREHLYSDAWQPGCLRSGLRTAGIPARSGNQDGCGPTSGPRASLPAPATKMVAVRPPDRGHPCPPWQPRWLRSLSLPVISHC